jgi:hypothetical protein
MEQQMGRQCFHKHPAKHLQKSAFAKYIIPKRFSHGQPLSYRLGHTAGMINRHPATKPKAQPRVVASFGRANLVRINGANYELRGVSDDDLTAAKEWVSLFLHEACIVLCEPPVWPCPSSSAFCHFAEADGIGGGLAQAALQVVLEESA